MIPNTFHEPVREATAQEVCIIKMLGIGCNLCWELTANRLEAIHDEKRIHGVVNKNHADYNLIFTKEYDMLYYFKLPLGDAWKILQT